MTTISPLGLLAAAFSFATGLTIDLNTAAVATMIAALVAAYPSYRLLAANRRKVLNEAGQIADDRVLAFSERVQQDNAALRDRVATLEGKLETTEHRCDVLERVLIEHGLPIPDA